MKIRRRHLLLPVGSRAQAGPVEVQTHLGRAADWTSRRALPRCVRHLRPTQRGCPILEKVRARRRDRRSTAARVERSKPFGLRTFFHGKPIRRRLKKPVKLFGSPEDRVGLERSGDSRRMQNWIDKWKVFMTRLSQGTQCGRSTTKFLSKPIIRVSPAQLVTETYVVAGHFRHRRRGDATTATYLRTRFVRFLVSLRKSTQDAHARRLRLRARPADWIEGMDRRKLYKRYGLTKDEIAFIESQVAEHDSDRSMRRSDESTMSKPTIEEILAPKPEARPRIYAYSIADEAHKGLLKVGQTTRDVKQRVAEQLKTAAIKNYKIELDESAERDDGTIFTDHEVRAALVKKGFENTELEWMRCTVKDVKTVLTELRTGQRFTGTHHETFAMRARAGRGREEDARLLPLDLEGGHARRPALPLEREDALRQDLHHLSARQEARRQARACGDLQARRRGCVADGPRIPRGLRRLAVPLAQLRQRPDQDRPRRSRSSISAPSRTCLAATPRGTSSPRTNGSTR